MSVKHVENNDLQTTLGDGATPALVDFYAEWCGPCKAMSPAIEALADEMGDSLIVAKVDTEKNAELAAKFNVSSIPTLVVFVNGKPAATHIGAMGGRELKDWVTQTAGTPTG
ncbi:MAG TPA: thioredoxin [Phycisphaerae bacterium]|nr:thioredoxin [Phycisphaerae bacterium]